MKKRNYHTNHSQLLRKIISYIYTC